MFSDCLSLLKFYIQRSLPEGRDDRGRGLFIGGLLVLIFSFLLVAPSGGSAVSSLTAEALTSPTSSLSFIQAQGGEGIVESTEEKIQQIQNLISPGVILLIIAILVITYLLVRLLVQVVDNLAERSSKYRLSIKRMAPVLRIFIWSVSLYIIIAGIIDPPLQTIIAVTASIGIAVGLASQEILKNIFGGFMIILDRPFQIGDKIRVDDHYGEVLQIGLRSTRIETPDDSVVALPNGKVISSAVSNANSGSLDCQVVAEIYLPANIDITQAKQIAYKAAISSRYVYLKKPVVILASSEVYEENFVIKLRVKAYVLDIRFEFPFQSDMTEQIMTELNRRSLIPAAGS